MIRRHAIPIAGLSVAVLLGTLLPFGSASSAVAEDAFYHISKNDLPKEEKLSRQVGRGFWSPPTALATVVMDGPGEGYVGADLESRQFRLRGAGGQQRPQRGLFVRAPEGQPVSGTIYFRKNSRAYFDHKIAFTLQPNQATEEARDEFFERKIGTFHTYLRWGYPGAAWFRHRIQETLAEQRGTEVDDGVLLDENWRTQSGQLQRTFELLSGARAVSENLQLDRLVTPEFTSRRKTVETASIPGIEIRELDWGPYLKGKPEPTFDPLANVVPHDQHVIFFRSFAGMVELIDEFEKTGVAVRQVMPVRTLRTNVRQRYETQLGVGLDDLVRTFGPQLIRSVAVTGSDPYLTDGTDLTIIAQSPTPTVLHSILIGKQNTIAQMEPSAVKRSETLNGVTYHSVVTPDRRVSSYMAKLDGGAVVITNSLQQIERLANVQAGKTEPISVLDEYRFFRLRYSLEDESERALVLLTDDTIRRWCGPKWRIAASRRARAAAILEQLSARHASSLVTGIDESKAIESRLYVPDLGELSLTSEGVVSTGYGSQRFMTPIAELDLEKVTQPERDAYNEWRERYQSYWRRFFDPIAFRLSMPEGKIEADLTVMPLISRSDYNQLISLTRDASLTTKPLRYPPTLLKMSASVNPKSPEVMWLDSVFAGIVEQNRDAGERILNPLSWLGTEWTFSCHPGPFWQELASASNQQEFLDERGAEIPAALTFASTDQKKLKRVMVAVRPTITSLFGAESEVETKTHAGQEYVRYNIERGGGRSLFFAGLPDRLVITPDEQVMRQTIELVAKPSEEKDASTQPIALGENFGVDLRGSAVPLLGSLFNGDVHLELQRRCWRTLPVLNDLRNRFPKDNPVDVYERIFHSRPICPVGGEFVWDADLRSMTSTVYGHPIDPKPVNEVELPVMTIFEGMRFGLTFEPDGLRARGQLMTK